MFGISYGQTRVVIRNAEGQVLEGVQVSYNLNTENGQSQTAWSDSLGVVEIRLNKSPSEVRFLKQGFLGEEVTLFEGSSNNIVLLSLDNEMEDFIFLATDPLAGQSRDQTVLNIDKISRQELDKLGAITLDDALRFQNNLQLTRDDNLGASGINVMGIPGENIKILVDGVPVIGRFLGQLDLEQFNLSNTQQIEMVKGPMSVLYGSNALAGTIQLISKTPSKRRALVQTNYDSRGDYDLSTSFGLPLGDSAGGIGITAGRLLFRGWSENDIDRSFDWIPKEQYNLGLNYQIKRKDWSLIARTNGVYSRLLNRGVPIAPYGERAVDLTYKNWILNNSISLSKSWNDFNTSLLVSNNYFKRNRNLWYKDLTDLSEVLVPNQEEQDTQSFSASLMRFTASRSWKTFSFISGAELDFEEGSGQRILGKVKAQSNQAMFFSGEQSIKRHKLRLGFRLVNNSIYGFNTLYGAQLKVQLPKSNSLRISYGKGYRTPSLKELYFSFKDSNHEVFGDSTLDPENSHSLLINFVNISSSSTAQFISELDLFYNDIDNKISLITSSAIAATYSNISRFKSLGATLSETYQYRNLDLKLGLSYIGVSNQIEEEDEPFQFSPQITVAPSFEWTALKMRVNLFMNYYGSLGQVSLDSGELVKTQRPAYTMMDVNIQKSFFNQKLRANVGLRNILDVKSLALSSEGLHSSNSRLSLSTGRSIFINLSYEIF